MLLFSYKKDKFLLSKWLTFNFFYKNHVFPNIFYLIIYIIGDLKILFQVVLCVCNITYLIYFVYLINPLFFSSFGLVIIYEKYYK